MNVRKSVENTSLKGLKDTADNECGFSAIFDDVCVTCKIEKNETIGTILFSNIRYGHMTCIQLIVTISLVFRSLY